MVTPLETQVAVTKHFEIRQDKSLSEAPFFLASRQSLLIACTKTYILE